MIWIICILLAILAIWLYWKFFKLPKMKNIIFVDGSLGSGKSFYSVAVAVRLFKKQIRLYRIKCFVIGKIVNKIINAVNWVFKKNYATKELPEKPQLYSNMRLRNIEFTLLTKDLIFRKQRFAYKSVVLIDEASLMIDQMCFKDKELNERMSTFFKLFRHETKGGYIVINSQTTSDLHYSLKYVISDYLYLHHRTKLPFVTIVKAQEMCYSADKDGASIVNARNEDIEETLKNVLVLNKYYKYYDSYCDSICTDSLPIYKKVEKLGRKDNLKTDILVSFKDFKYLYENLEKEHKENENLQKNS